MNLFLGARNLFRKFRLRGPARGMNSALQATPGSAAQSAAFSPNSEVGAGSTGDPPVPSGHWPDGTGRVLALKTSAWKSSRAFPVPSGGSPPGTGQWPVLPGGLAVATSEFGFSAPWNLSCAIKTQNHFALALIWHGLIFVCLLCPPNFMASEPAGETAEPLISEAPVATSTADAATNSEVNLSSAALEKPVPPKSAGQETARADTEKLLKQRLELARNFRHSRLAPKAEPILVELLEDGNPDAIRQPALLELALCAQDQNDLPRALQIYAQFLNRWPGDPHMPEILLRQGQFFRQLGMNSMALAKFYSVMTAALALKNDHLDYYKQLVVLAQTEIAETHYQMGKYADAAEYFARLLKQNSPLLNHPQAQYRLLHALSETGRHDEAVSQAQDYLTRYPAAADLAEVRFTLAHSLKELGRNGESLQQVLALLQEQKGRAADHPEVWAYWQQRAGNEIANQLYREGDYTRALDVYISLAQLDHAPTWQIPVNYQVGMTYERLQQPQLASLTYSNIISRELEAGTNATPGLKSVFAMARWRINFLNWQSHAETITHEFAEPPRSPSAAELQRTGESAVAADPKS